jgi:hypothetical protein
LLNNPYLGLCTEEVPVNDPTPVNDPNPAAPRRQRRWIIIAAAVAAVLALAAGGAVAYAVLNRPDTARQAVDGYLKALRDGDIDAAVEYWEDAPATRTGGKGLRDRVRDYVTPRIDAYRQALGGRAWTVEEYEARLGPGIRVHVESVTIVYALTVDDDDNARIWIDPEDSLGRPDPDGHPLFALT